MPAAQKFKKLVSQMKDDELIELRAAATDRLRELGCEVLLTDEAKDHLSGQDHIRSIFLPHYQRLGVEPPSLSVGNLV